MRRAFKKIGWLSATTVLALALLLQWPFLIEEASATEVNIDTSIFATGTESNSGTGRRHVFVSDQVGTRLIVIGPAIRGKPRYTVRGLIRAYGDIIEHSPVIISNGAGVFQCTVRIPSHYKRKRMRETTIELRGKRNSLSYRMVRPEIVECFTHLFRCQVRSTVIFEASPFFLRELD